MNRRLKGKIIEIFGSQIDFAEAIEEDETFISRIVRGRRSLPPEKQKKWARALGYDENELSKTLENN